MGWVPVPDGGSASTPPRWMANQEHGLRAWRSSVDHVTLAAQSNPFSSLISSGLPQQHVGESMSLKIYDWHNGPYPARVRIAWAEKGMQSRTCFVSINLRKWGAQDERVSREELLGDIARAGA